MRALSVRHPWAYLIIAGIKDVENRNWPTRHRGVLAIHTSGHRPSRDEYADALELCEQLGVVLPPAHALAYGAVIGSVEIVDCVTHHASPWYEPGGFGFVLVRPRALAEPIPIRGQLGLWELPAGILAQL